MATVTLPNLVVAGFPRCGTSALFDWFCRYPGAGTSSKKETRFFMDPEYPLFDPGLNHRDHGLAGYETYFENAASDHPLVVEATPDYAYQATALQHVPYLPTQPAVVFSVRDPIDRITSFFTFARERMGTVPTSTSLEAYVRALVSDPQPEWLSHRPLLAMAIEQSRYDRWLEAWQRALGRSRLHVIQFERLIRYPHETLSALLATLADSLPPAGETPFHLVNPSATPRWPGVARLASGIRRQMIDPARESRFVGEVAAPLIRMYRRFMYDTSELPSSLHESLRGRLAESAQRTVSYWDLDPTLWATTLDQRKENGSVDA